jgi:hypothetical protein
MMIPSWEIRKLATLSGLIAFAMKICPVLGLKVVFAATENTTAPFPVTTWPTVGEVTVTHGPCADVTRHVQPITTATANLPLPPAAVNDANDGLRPKWQSVGPGTVLVVVLVLVVGVVEVVDDEVVVDVVGPTVVVVLVVGDVVVVDGTEVVVGVTVVVGDVVVVDGTEVVVGATVVVSDVVVDGTEVVVGATVVVVLVLVVVETDVVEVLDVVGTDVVGGWADVPTSIVKPSGFVGQL